MKVLMTAAVATALLDSLIGGTPARADEDCDNVVKAMEEAISISTKSLEQTMEELKKTTSGGADDKTKTTVKHTFCSVGGELLGTSRAFRAVAAECLKGNKRTATLASLDQSIKEMDTTIEGTCK
jgi:hypothetical protein